ncbi:MAG: efflux RND transporter periplasmic adaptor subunit [Verrucomicrobium sp.]|nr:efflux RND transporter periplasmic adaptor subunit [Verrucomicrobium sp.]
MNLRPAPVAFSVLLALGLTSCFEKPEAAGPQAMPPMPVTVEHAVKQKITEWDEFTGRLDASESVNLYSQVTGYLKSVHFKDGTEVKKGDLLFTVDPRPFQATLDMTTAQLDQARVKLELSRNEFDRATKLLAAKAISAEDFDTRAKAVREAEAGLKVAEATVEKSKLDVEYTEIKAPVDGRIGRRLMDPGGLVIGGPMGASMLASIVSLDPMYCYIDADELTVLRYQRLNRTGGGSAKEEDRIPCEVALADDEGFPHKGVIDFVDNRMDPGTGTIQVRVLLANPRPERGQRVLQPGYFTRVRVPGQGDYEALTVDDKAVGFDQAQKIVMIVDDKNIVMPRPVEVGPMINGRRVIRKGLTEADKIVSHGFVAKIRPGMPVVPMTPEEAAKMQAQASPPPAAAAQ